MLELDTCCKSYRTGAFGSGELLAVRDVSFAVSPGEVVSLIGESGSGKSTIGKMILRLVPTTRGSITFDGLDISTLKGRKLKEYYADVQGFFAEHPIPQAVKTLDQILERQRVNAAANVRERPRLAAAV